MEAGSVAAADPTAYLQPSEVNVPTWAEERLELERRLQDFPADVAREILEQARRLRAPERHRARVEAAIKAAREAAVALIGLDEGDAPRWIDHVAGALCHMDLRFHGGYTRRAEWAQNLGSGRRYAADGDAWDVAIEEARNRLLNCTEPRFVVAGGLVVEVHDDGVWASVVPAPPEGYGREQFCRAVLAALGI